MRVIRDRSAATTKPTIKVRESNAIIRRARMPYTFTGQVAGIMAQAAKEYGDKVIRAAADLPQWNHVSTGIFMLDFALLGGWGKGLATSVFGWEGCGKTTELLLSIAEQQRRFEAKEAGRVAALIDVESTFDPLWAEILGVDTEKLLLVQPDSGEQAVDIIDALSRAEEVGFIGLDSIPALVPQKMIDDSAEDALVATVARLTARMCSKLSQSFLTERKRGHYLTFMSVNQFRMKIGRDAMFGDPRILPGGIQQNYFNTTKVELKKKEIAGKDSRGFDVIDVNQHTFDVKKCKIGNSLKTGDFEMVVNPDHILGQGSINECHTIGEYAKKFDLVEGKAMSKASKPSKKAGRGLYVPAWDWRFSGPKELESKLQQDKLFNLWARQQVIMIQREEKGLPALPRNKWLLAPLVK